jgi:hypothetical protein
MARSARKIGVKMLQWRRLQTLIGLSVLLSNLHAQDSSIAGHRPAYLLFPQDRLFERRLADPTEVQLSAGVLTRRDEFAGNIGYSLGLVQFNWPKLAAQFRIAADVLLVSKISAPDFPVQSTDYSITLPFDIRRAPFSWRIEIGHLSSHLGDNFNRINDIQDRLEAGQTYWRAKKYSKEFLRLFGSRALADLRAYGGCIWDFHIASNVSEIDKPDRLAIQYGVEWLAPHEGRTVYPYAGIDIKQKQEFSWHLDSNIQVGGVLQNGDGRRVRLAVEFYRGYSSQGQFFRRLEHDINLVMIFDF